MSAETRAIEALREARYWIRQQELACKAEHPDRCWCPAGRRLLLDRIDHALARVSEGSPLPEDDS